MADSFSRGVTAGAHDQGNVMLGFLAGLIAAVVGAVLWMGIDVGLDVHLGLIAVAIGALVGLAIRFAGHGGSPLFGFMGALLTLGGCLAGDILAMLYRQVSPQHDFYSIAASADYVQLANVVFSHIQPMGYVIYGIALYEGYKLSIVKYRSA